MKKIFIAMAVLLLLTACEKEQLVDELETTRQTDAAAIQTDETTAAVSAAEPSQTTLAGFAESKAETSEAAETKETAAAETKIYESDGIKMRYFDYGKLVPALSETAAWNSSVKGNIICIEHKVINDGELSPEKLELIFFDMKENSYLQTVEITGGWNIDSYIKGDGDIFCKALMYRRMEDENGEFLGFDNAVAIVRDDYTCEIAKYTSQNAAFEHYGHHIAEWEGNIVDTDKDETIVYGFTAKNGEDENGFLTETPRYDFPIDENRFVYRIGGYERLPGFGIYDFETGTASKVPDSTDLIPVGYSDGYIYSVKTAWDGFGTELYRTDINTLETEFFMDYKSVSTSAYVRYQMPPDGSYISILTEEPYGSDNDEMFYVVDIKTGEQRKAVIPEPSEFGAGIEYSDSGEAFIANWWGKILLISVSDTE
ncbi:MAG: hypothetical protein K2N71_00270 [Oscillospiraceae bacterium]|nr:hypothetical protein [Oscillospiraceae bacterium]